MLSKEYSYINIRIGFHFYLIFFDHIDFQNKNSIKCIWKRKNKQGEIDLDIDDLSSSEKSILILLIPLLDQALDSELFVLGFKNEDENSNQLKKFANNFRQTRSSKTVCW